MSSKGENNTRSVGQYIVSCTSAWTEQFSAQRSHAIFKTKIELDLHADTCVTDDQCLIIPDYNRPVNVYGYDAKVGSTHAHRVNATVTYYERQISFSLLNKPGN